MADLNRILDYNLINKKPNINAATQKKVDDHVIIDKEDWIASFCSDLKSETKSFYARRQNKKCAYCRMSINPDGYTDPIEHITPRKLKPYWMFVQYNLVVSCGGCNSFKGHANMLVNGINTYGNLTTHCPVTTNDYYIFNPHFDKWSDHFEIEDDCFLKPKTGTKGPFTYSTLGMKRYHIVIDYLTELKFREKKSYQTLNKRIRKEKDNDKLEQLKLALKYFEDIMNNDN